MGFPYSAYSQQAFESIKHVDENGNEFWYARELHSALEYREWRNFEKSLDKAKSACEFSGINKNDHFVDVNKMINLAKGARREVADVKLSRYACYLIVMNGDPRKELPDPAKLPPQGNINLLELAKYAKVTGKDISKMTLEEIEKFKI